MTVLHKLDKILILRCRYHLLFHGFIEIIRKQSQTHFTYKSYLKLSEECSIAEDKKTQETKMVRKISLQRETAEGTIVGEIDILSKEEVLGLIKQDAESMKSQPVDDIFETKEIKESITVEPVPSALKEDVPVSEVVRVDKTPKTSLIYSHVEAENMEKPLSTTEDIVRNEEMAIDTDIESYFPINVTKNEEEKERTHHLDSVVPEKDVAMETITCRKTSTTQVSTFSA